MDKKWKVKALVDIVEAVAATDAARAGRLADDAERIARSITSKRRKESALDGIYNAVVATDPDRAARVARANTDKHRKALALVRIAEAVSATEPGQAAQLVDEAERVAQSITPCSRIGAGQR